MNYPCESITQITRSIYISDWEGSLDTEVLNKLNIRAILCLNDRKKPDYYLDKYIENDIKHFQIFIQDDPHANIYKYFNDIYNFIFEESDRHCVLLHCTAGISRSVTALASYLLRYGISRDSRITTDFILQFIKSKRPCIDPNPGFVAQLKYFENNLR